MNIYRRTFSVLVPHWKRLMVASVSAALHAVLSGVLVWMVGPLMMTLFQGGEDGSLFFHGGDTVQQEPYAGTGGEESAAVPVIQVSSWLVELKESMKDAINGLVAAETRQKTLVNFCLLILVVVVAKNLFLYLQGFFMAFVQQSVVRHFRDRLFEKYQRLSLDYFHRRRTGESGRRIGRHTGRAYQVPGDIHSLQRGQSDNGRAFAIKGNRKINQGADRSGEQKWPKRLKFNNSKA